MLLYQVRSYHFSAQDQLDSLTLLGRWQEREETPSGTPVEGNIKKKHWQQEGFKIPAIKREEVMLLLMITSSCSSHNHVRWQFC